MTMKCKCHPGFKGEYCEEKKCMRPCLNEGKCIDGVCFCEIGWAGKQCELSKIFLIYSFCFYKIILLNLFKFKLESCFNNCNNKGNCVNGQCVCNAFSTGLYCEKSKIFKLN